MTERTVCTDALGVEHRRADPEFRIVSLVPSLTELLCELGLSGSIVGRTGFCIHPRETVKEIEKVGGTKDVNVQKIREMHPTHVVVNIDENTKEIADELGTFVEHIVVTHPNVPRDNIALFDTMGFIFSAEERAAYRRKRRVASDHARAYERQAIFSDFSLHLKPSRLYTDTAHRTPVLNATRVSVTATSPTSVGK